MRGLFSLEGLPKEREPLAPTFYEAKLLSARAFKQPPTNLLRSSHGASVQEFSKASLPGCPGDSPMTEAMRSFVLLGYLSHSYRPRGSTPCGRHLYKMSTWIASSNFSVFPVVGLK